MNKSRMAKTNAQIDADTHYTCSLAGRPLVDIIGKNDFLISQEQFLTRFFQESE